MKQKGRKSTASLSVIAAVGLTRPDAPDDLNDAEKALWRRITATKSADYFDEGTLSLLAEYCRNKSTLDLLASSISDYDPTWLLTDDGVARYKSLVDLRDKVQGRTVTLARSMRLTNQSRYHPSVAASKASNKSNDRLWAKD